MRKIITNTSPVIALSMIDSFHLLWELFDEVYIPDAVIGELIKSKDKRDYGRQEILRAIKTRKVRPYSVQDKRAVQRLQGKLHTGELETIIGGTELGVDFALIDEIAARKMAKQFSLDLIGTLGILRLAKANEKIKSIKPYVDTLIANGYRISKNLYEQILRAEGEWEPSE